MASQKMEEGDCGYRHPIKPLDPSLSIAIKYECMTSIDYKIWQVLISKPENRNQQLEETRYMLPELVQNSKPSCKAGLRNCIENAN